MKLEYELNKDNYKELHSYMALHDRHIQKRLLYFMISLTIGIVVLAIVIFRIGWTMLLVSIIGAILMFTLFPKFFWKTEFKRIDHIVDNAEIKFSKMNVQINNSIEVKDQNHKYVIPFANVENIDFTKNNCMIFYKENEKVNTLIIPNSCFNDEELKSFYLDLEGKIQNAKK